MEINVTFVRDELEPQSLSASQLELGPNAGAITWHNCLHAAEVYRDFLPLEAYDEARDHFREYGAWSDEEIDEWDAQEVRALLIQDAAASIREAEAGGDDGRVYEGDSGELYFWLGI